jgi:hypothetical protein
MVVEPLKMDGREWFPPEKHTSSIFRTEEEAKKKAEASGKLS